MIDADVDIWVAHLDGIATEVERLRGLLDHAELERAARFRPDLARRRFTAKHAVRRLLLARYLGQPPQNIAFLNGDGRKPQIAGLQPGQLDFNESASGELAVFAVARGMQLGVDLEQIRPVPDAAEIVARFGSTVEAAAYQRLPKPDRDTAFLRWWTAKEAFVKAIGSGLDHPLDTFSISFPSDDAIRLVDVGGNQNEAARYSLTELTPAAGYVGTLVVAGRQPRILQRGWSPNGRMKARGAA